MRTLACFEIDGVLDCSARARAVAKQALRGFDWELCFITARSQERAPETLALLADKLKTTQHPRPAPVYWCGRQTPAETQLNKIQTLRNMLTHRPHVERLVVFDNDLGTLSAYETLLRARKQPRSYTLYRVVDGLPVVFSGSAVQATEPISE